MKASLKSLWQMFIGCKHVKGKLIKTGYVQASSIDAIEFWTEKVEIRQCLKCNKEITWVIWDKFDHPVGEIK